MNKKSMLRAVRLAALLWASAFVLTGCGGGGDAIDTTVSYPSTADRIAMGWEPWPRPTYVVNTRDEWSRVWNERYASQSCYHFDGPDCVRAAMPEIDFDRFTLIGI